MKALLHSGSRPCSLRWPVMAALLVLSLSAVARDGQPGSGHRGGTHAGSHFGHSGARHHGAFHRGGGSAFFGFGFGPSWYEPYGYSYGYPIGYGYAPAYVYPPGYAYPPGYVYPGYAYPPGYAAAPAYPQRLEPSQYGYRDYCSESNAYYPSVSQCPGGWQRVPFQPSVR